MFAPGVAKPPKPNEPKKTKLLPSVSCAGIFQNKIKKGGKFENSVFFEWIDMTAGRQTSRTCGTFLTHRHCLSLVHLSLLSICGMMAFLYSGHDNDDGVSMLCNLFVVIKTDEYNDHGYEQVCSIPVCFSRVDREHTELVVLREHKLASSIRTWAIPPIDPHSSFQAIPTLSSILNRTHPLQISIA